MTYRHEYSTTFQIGRNERDICVTYSMSDDEAVIEFVEVCVETKQAFLRPIVKTWEPAPRWLVDIIENDPDLLKDMAEAAAPAASRADHERDRRREMV